MEAVNRDARLRFEGKNLQADGEAIFRNAARAQRDNIAPLLGNMANPFAAGNGTLGQQLLQATGMAGAINQPTKTYYDERLTVSFRTGKVDQQNIEQCRGNVNSDSITLTVKGYPRTFAAKTLKLEDTPISSVIVDKDYNWDVEYVMDYRKDTWARKILNMGRVQIPAANKDIAPIYVGQQLATEDVPLDKNGKAIVDGKVVAAKKVSDAAAGERCYLEFSIENEVSFGGLLRGVK